MAVRRVGRLSISVFALFVAVSAHAQPQVETPAEVVAPLVATPLASPNPVLGSDDKTHLVYEFVLVNMAGSILTIEKVETLDAAADRAAARGATNFAFQPRSETKTGTSCTPP